MKAVVFDHFGGLDVLQIKEVPVPKPGTSQVLVRVKAAGINPGEASIREGKLNHMFPTVFPSGEGSDFSGIVEEIGEGSQGFEVGNEVIGFTNNRNSHAEYVLAEADQLVFKPKAVSWEEGGALFVVGTTAWACVHAVNLKAGETVVVSGAAGGVGSIVIQLAKNIGAKVIGLAGEANQDWLAGKGIVPVVYGNGQLERIQKAAGGPIHAFIDTYGQGYAELALELGVSPQRINTIIDFEAVHKFGIKAEGSGKAATKEVLKALSEMIATGKLVIPIAKSFPLDQVIEAFRALEDRHTRGKIVLIP